VRDIFIEEMGSASADGEVFVTIPKLDEGCVPGSRCRDVHGGGRALPSFIESARRDIPKFDEGCPVGIQGAPRFMEDDGPTSDDGEVPGGDVRAATGVADRWAGGCGATNLAETPVWRRSVT
jgi:hypothetical protein